MDIKFVKILDMDGHILIAKKHLTTLAYSIEQEQRIQNPTPPIDFIDLQSYKSDKLPSSFYHLF